MSGFPDIRGFDSQLDRGAPGARGTGAETDDVNGCRERSRDVPRGTSRSSELIALQSHSVLGGGANQSRRGIGFGLDETAEPSEHRQPEASIRLGER
jgi:hypothetical protein